jgi:hypothetical protein
MTYINWNIASLASRASYSFATAQKSNQTNFAGAKLNSCFIAGLKGKTQDVICNRPPLFVCPEKKHSGFLNSPLLPTNLP